MLGGLYKRTAYLNDYRKTHKNLVIVDSGDLLNEHYEIKDSFMPSARLKGELVAKICKGIGIDAINVGELELALGMDFLKGLEKKYGTPFVSANLVGTDNKLLFKPYVIKDLQDMKVGIIGIMGNTSDVEKKMKEIVGSSMTVLDPIETAEKMVSEIEGKVDFIIVMTHQLMNRNWKVARSKGLKGKIDVIIGGHQKLKLKKPYNASGTFIAQSGEKGQHQGMLEVEIGADGKNKATNTLVALSDKMPNDPEVKKMVDEFNVEVNKLYSKGATGKDEDVELRNDACNDCHSEAVEAWAKTDHAKAFQTLINKNQQFNPDCLACHTTRFEEAGGFTMDAQQKELRNVQCESCHGDATAHLEDPGSVPAGDPGVELCIKCHTEHRCPDFEKEYQKEWSKIAH